MEIIAKYIHGSEDSTDVDVVYVVDELPDKIECKRFCSADSNENRNLIVIRDGIVSEVYKGTVDEVNNALLSTYFLHEQSSPLLVKHHVERIPSLKYVRGVRIILSHLSRSQYRMRVKNALHGSWSERLQTLLDIDIALIDFTTLNKNMSREDILKTIAFQIAQMDGLMHNMEIYTKRDAAEAFPILKQFLYRDPNSNIYELSTELHGLIDSLMWDVWYYMIDKVTGRLTTIRIPLSKDKFCDIDLMTEQLIDIDSEKNTVDNMM